MTCKKCGTAVEDGKKFCPTCGNPMAAPEAAAPAAESPMQRQIRLRCRRDRVPMCRPMIPL